MAPKLVTFFFLMSLTLVWSLDERSFITSVEVENKFGEYSIYLSNWLKNLNDRNLINSDVGRMLHYQELEPKVEKAASAVEGRSLKRIGSILPLIFHLGMTSAWMLLTTLLAAKSVAIGLTLLVLKIAVGSAKLASYFTAWKNKHHHYEYVPHHEHHGHKRSLRSIESHIIHPDSHGYSPEYASYSPQEHYASPHEASPYYAQAYGEYEYPAETKKAQEKNIVVNEEPCLEAKLKLKMADRKPDEMAPNSNVRGNYGRRPYYPTEDDEDDEMWNVL